jgi:hypothetical protein
MSSILVIPKLLLTEESHADSSSMQIVPKFLVILPPPKEFFLQILFSFCSLFSYYGLALAFYFLRKASFSIFYSNLIYMDVHTLRWDAKVEDDSLLA